MKDDKGHAARGHHPYGPSSLGNLERSPCFRSRSGNNAASLLGTAQHEATESGELDNSLSDEHADAVARALRMVSELVETLENAGHKVIQIAEEYLHIDNVSTEGWIGSTGGYPDRVVLYQIAPGQYYAYVLDWKFGQYAVTEARNNRQGQAYLLGVDHVLATQGIEGARGRIVAGMVVFFSPHRDDEPSQHEFSADEFDKLRKELEGIVVNAQRTRQAIAKQGFDNDDPNVFRMSTATCAFCALIGKCPAVRALALRIAQKYKPAEAPADLRGSEVGDPKLAADGLKVAGIVATWAKSYRKRLTDAAFENPDQVPDGYRLTCTFPTKVVKPIELYEALVGTFGKDVVHEHIELPLTPFDTIVSDKAPRGEKGKAKEEFRDALTKAGLTEPSPVPTVSLRMK